MRYYLGFGLPAALLGGLLFFWTYNRTDWNPYIIWLAAWSIVTFAVYGLDKLLSKAGTWRVPELILHLLALLGGFPGGWAGIAAFRHKSNFRHHPGIWIVLILATLGHAALASYWFLRGS